MGRIAYETRTHATLKTEWHFDEASGDILDQVGSVDLTVDADNTYAVTSPAPPFSGEAGDPGSWHQIPFDGVCYGAGGFTAGEDYAIEMIFRPFDLVNGVGFMWSSTGSGAEAITWRLDTPTVGTGLAIMFRDRWNSNLDIMTSDGGGNSNGVISQDTTYHLVIRRIIGGSTKIFLNAVEQTTESGGAVLNPADTGTIVIGAQGSGGDNSLRSYWSNVRIYETDAVNTSLPADSFWSDHYADITAGGSNIPTIMNHYRRLRAA